MLVGALDANQVKVAALLLAALLVVVGVVFTAAAARFQAKVIGLAVMLGLAALVWSQRASLSSCVDDARAGGGRATCTFFGVDVDVDLPDAPGG